MPLFARALTKNYFNLILITVLILHPRSVSTDGLEGYQDSINIDQPLNKEALETLNKYRKLHGVPPIEFDFGLAQNAAKWARKIHDKSIKEGKLRAYYSHPHVEGETVMVMDQTSDPLDGKTAIDTWYSEIKNFNFSTNQFSFETAQFTQLVWKDTKLAGVATLHDPRKNYSVIVARFKPPGNLGFDMSFAENVFPPSSSNVMSKDNLTQKPIQSTTPVSIEVTNAPTTEKYTTTVPPAVTNVPTTPSGVDQITTASTVGRSAARSLVEDSPTDFENSKHVEQIIQSKTTSEPGSNSADNNNTDLDFKSKGNSSSSQKPKLDLSKVSYPRANNETKGTDTKLKSETNSKPDSKTTPQPVVNKKPQTHKAKGRTIHKERPKPKIIAPNTTIASPEVLVGHIQDSPELKLLPSAATTTTKKPKVKPKPKPKGRAIKSKNKSSPSSSRQNTTKPIVKGRSVPKSKPENTTSLEKNTHSKHSPNTTKTAKHRSSHPETKTSENSSLSSNETKILVKPSQPLSETNDSSKPSPPPQTTVPPKPTPPPPETNDPPKSSTPPPQANTTTTTKPLPPPLKTKKTLNKLTTPMPIIIPAGRKMDAKNETKPPAPVTKITKKTTTTTELPKKIKHVKHK